MTTDDDLFDGCEALDEILALTFDLAGPEGLKELLTMVELDRAPLNAAANGLKAAGLVEAAKIVAETAARAADPTASDRHHLERSRSGQSAHPPRRPLQARTSHNDGP